MRYANLSFRKVTGLVLIVIALTVLVFSTAVTWQNKLGALSVSNMELQTRQFSVMWFYRMQYAWDFLRAPASDPRSLLAMIENTASFLVSPSSHNFAVAENSARSIPVLVYHGIVSKSDGTDITVDAFKSQMFALKADGWQTVSIYDLLDAMQGRKTLPPKSFVLTFDDGRKDSYYPVDPILQALDYHAVMYVITGHSLAPGNEKSHYYLSAGELSNMLASGRWDLQSHSRLGHSSYPTDASGTLVGFFEGQLWIPKQNPGESQADYANRVNSDFFAYYSKGTLWDLANGRLESTAEYSDRIYTDLLGAKQDLENKLHIKVVSFSYPYNLFSQLAHPDLPGGRSTLFETVEQIYPISFYQWSPTQGYSEDYPGKDGQLLRRLEPKPNWSTDYLVNLMTTGQAKDVPFTAKFDGADGWRSTWGSVNEGGGQLTIAANTSTVGALALLDGTRLWKDYTFNMKFDWQAGQGVSLAGHYQRDVLGQSFVECMYQSDGNVLLRTNQDGNATVLAQSKDAEVGPGVGKKAGLVFVGNYAECLWNGGVVLGAQVPSTAPQDGGIGIEAFDANRDVSRLTVTSATAAQSTP